MGNEPLWPILERDHDAWRRMMDLQDDCLIAMSRGHPLPVHKLQGLPPWRAVLIARVAAKAGIPLEHGSLEQLVAEARKVTGSGKLGSWWE
jgi:hypothetical protein